MSDNSIASRGGPIENPLVGHEFRYFRDRFRILESSRDTDDGSLRGDYFAPPGAKVPEHVHCDQEERFEVISGTLCIRMGGRAMTLTPGQSAVGPPGVPHRWWNPSDDEEVHFLVRLHPGRDVETLLETLLGLAREGKTTRTGIPKNPLQLAVLLDEIGRWAYVTEVPMPVQKVLFVPLVSLAFVGRLLGYKASYPEYSGSEPPLGIEDERPSEASEASEAMVVVGIVVAGVIALLALVALLRRARRSSG
jgi:quercetin dioxygenase-like cupin family protein